MTAGLWWERIRYSARHRGSRLAMGGSLLVLLVLGWDVAFHRYPVYREYQQLTSTVHAETARARQRLELHRLAEAYADAEVRLNSMEERLTSRPSRSQLIAAVAERAAHHGMAIASTSFQETNANGVLRLQQDITFASDYSALRGVLKDIDALPGWTLVRELAVEKGEDGELKGSLRLVTLISQESAR